MFMKEKENKLTFFSSVILVDARMTSDRNVEDDALFYVDAGDRKPRHPH